MYKSIGFFFLLCLWGIHGNNYEEQGYIHDKRIGGWLKMQTRPKTWRGARIRCHVEGAFLATPWSPEFVAAINDLQTSHQGKQNVSVVYSGVFETDPEGAYSVVEGSQTISLDPRDMEQYERCGVIFANGSTSTLSCNRRLPFVCFAPRTSTSDLDPPASDLGHHSTSALDVSTQDPILTSALDVSTQDPILTSALDVSTQDPILTSALDVSTQDPILTSALDVSTQDPILTSALDVSTQDPILTSALDVSTQDPILTSALDVSTQDPILTSALDVSTQDPILTSALDVSTQDPILTSALDVSTQDPILTSALDVSTQDPILTSALDVSTQDPILTSALDVSTQDPILTSALDVSTQDPILTSAFDVSTHDPISTSEPEDYTYDPLSTSFEEESTAIPVPAPTGCDKLAGYEYYSLTESCYKLHGEVAFWTQANSTCNREGAHLLVINSEDEASAVAYFIRTKILNSESVPVGVYRKPAGEWMTVTGESLAELDWDEWDYGEPDNENVWSYAFFVRNGKLYTGTNNYLRPFICEINK